MTDWGLDDFMLQTMDKIGTHNFNKLDEEINLRRFHDTQRLEERKQLRREEVDDMEKKETVRVRIATELQRARDRAAFMEKWIEEGRESWQVNEDKRVEREKHLLEYELAVVAKREAKRENNRLVHQHDGKSNISSFERNMKRLGVGNDDTDPTTFRPSHESGLNYLQRLDDTVKEASLDPSGNYEAMENLHRAAKVNKKATKERETRRRKMQVDQNVAQRELSKREAHGMMMEGLARSARETREANYGAWEMKKKKEIEGMERYERVDIMSTVRVSKQESLLKEYFAKTAVELESEESLAKKQARLDEIAQIKVDAKAKKRVHATAVCNDAVDKLLDLVEIIAGEREQLQGPIAPQLYRDLKKLYVSSQPFFDPPPIEDDDEWNLLEECKGYAEGSSWIEGEEGAEWGYPELVLLLPNPTESPLADYETEDYAVTVKAALCGLARDEGAIKDYVAWTLYEYASFLRRDDDNWAVACEKHTQILKMDTADNTDLQEIEDAIDLLEEDLGDVAEERVEAARDVCDGSSGRAKEWIAALTTEREDGMRGLCSTVVNDAAGKIGELRRRRIEVPGAAAQAEKEEVGKESIVDDGTKADDADGEEKKEERCAKAVSKGSERKGSERSESQKLSGQDVLFSSP